MGGWDRRRVLLGLATAPGAVAFGACTRPEVEAEALAALPVRARVARQLLELAALEPCTTFPVHEQSHALQAGTRAWRAAPDVAALCHDLGSLVGKGHAETGARLLQYYVRPEIETVVLHHGVFQRRFREDVPEDTRDRYLIHRDAPWFELALRFSDELDQPSGDPDYDALPIEAFEPLLAHVFEKPRYRHRRKRGVAPDYPQRRTATDPTA